MATIELQQVEKRFGDCHAVKPLDLTISDGEFVVLLGPSGCGKTTTLRMISGLEAVTGGQILLNGKEVTWKHPSERDMAFVFQFYALYSHLSVRQNIAFPLQAQGMKRDAVDKRVKEVVDILRIRHLLRARPGKLSGGDQQRVALARALVRRPVGLPDGRAPRGPGCGAARVHARGDQEPAPRPARHHRVCHPRPGRGHGHGGQDRGHVAGGGSAGRHAHGGVLQPRQPLRGPVHRQPRHESASKGSSREARCVCRAGTATRSPRPGPAPARMRWAGRRR